MNVIFVVSGTNDNREIQEGILKVGAPADSLNSLVVNSVRRDGQPAGYSRKGNILSFYNKPDISYYGGDFNDRITAYTSYGTEEVYGTSFAALGSVENVLSDRCYGDAKGDCQGINN